MAVYKDEQNGKWRSVYRYTDWTGEKKQTQKRGFLTRREALAWEREQMIKNSANLDMTFTSFIERYNAPLEYAELVLNGDPEKYLKDVTEYKRLD